MKQFATNAKYNYDSLVNTDDVEQFFSQNTGTDLKPLFNLYLRTTDKLEVHLKSLPGNKYLVQLQNISIPLPLDIATDSGVKHIIADSKGVQISSKTMPVVDPEVFYIKKVIIE